MGGDLSANYDQIAPIFIVDMWRVHSAIKKDTGEQVSLWILDDNQMANNCKTKQEKEKVIETATNSIQQMRKLRHPNVLKINEVSGTSFSAEPVKSSLLYDTSLTTDEVSYISLQLAKLIKFFNQNAHIAHLGLCPSAVCLTDALDIKLCSFGQAAPLMGTDGKIATSISWSNSPFCSPLNFTAPEIVSNHQFTISADIFSFGAIVASAFLKRHIFSCSTPYEFISTVTSGITFSFDQVSQDMRDLLKRCIALKPEVRPTIDEILKSSAFNSITLKTINYFDEIFTKPKAEIFNFLKSLLPGIGTFSTRILTYKFLPAIFQQLDLSILFAPVCIPLVVKIGSSFSRRDFQQNILSKIGNLLTCANPPELLLGVFSVIDVLVDRIEKERLGDIVLPIYQAGLSNPDKRLPAAAMKNLGIACSSFPQTVVVKQLLPKVSEFIIDSDPETIDSLAECIEFVDNDVFASIILPSIGRLFDKNPSPEMADSICQLLIRMSMSAAVKVKRGVSVAAILLGSDLTTFETQKLLCGFIEDSVNSLKSERKLESEKPPKVSKPKAKSIKESKPIKAPLQTKPMLKKTIPKARIGEEIENDDQAIPDSFWDD